MGIEESNQISVPQLHPRGGGKVSPSRRNTRRRKKKGWVLPCHRDEYPRRPTSRKPQNLPTDQGTVHRSGNDSFKKGEKEGGKGTWFTPHTIE